MQESCLIPFLYLLIRDEVTLGTVERIMKDIGKYQNVDCKAIYSNQFLVDYARDIASRLTNS